MTDMSFTKKRDREKINDTSIFQQKFHLTLITMKNVTVTVAGMNQKNM